MSEHFDECDLEHEEPEPHDCARDGHEWKPTTWEFKFQRGGTVEVCEHCRLLRMGGGT